MRPRSCGAGTCRDCRTGHSTLRAPAMMRWSLVPGGDVKERASIYPAAGFDSEHLHADARHRMCSQSASDAKRTENPSGTRCGSRLAIRRCLTSGRGTAPTSLEAGQRATLSLSSSCDEHPVLEITSVMTEQIPVKDADATTAYPASHARLSHRERQRLPFSGVELP